jgi:hypothetical protein
MAVAYGLGWSSTEVEVGIVALSVVMSSLLLVVELLVESL